MKAVARYSDADFTGIVWGLYWRTFLAGIAVSVVVGMAAGAVVAFIGNMVEGFRRMPVGVSALNEAGLSWLPAAAGFLAGSIVNFYVLKWILRSRIGKKVGDSMLLIVAVSNDKDSENAN